VQVQYDFAGLTSSGLDRIEVLRGSQSALYGSEAIGGLVDITTFRPTDRGFSGNSSLEYGAHDTTVGALNLGYATTRGEVALTYGVARSDGFSAKANNTENDGFYQDMVTLFGDYDINEDVTAGVSVYWRDRTADYDGTTVTDISRRRCHAPAVRQPFRRDPRRSDRIYQPFRGPARTDQL
jgi:vitamin B12 transporter